MAKRASDQNPRHRGVVGSKDLAACLSADRRVRKYLEGRLSQAGISKILIERTTKSARITFATARLGMVIGKRGEDIEKLRKDVSDLMGVPTYVDVAEIRQPELDAQLVAEAITHQLERHIMYRRAMKRAVQNALRFGAQGAKVSLTGCLGGAEMTRSEWYREGRVPLHTLRADIEYGFAEARTTYGIVGVQVWIYRGDVLGLPASGDHNLTEHMPELAAQAGRAAYERALASGARLVMTSASGELIERQPDGSTSVIKSLPAATPVRSGDVLRRTVRPSESVSPE